MKNSFYFTEVVIEIPKGVSEEEIIRRLAKPKYTFDEFQEKIKQKIDTKNEK